MPIFGLTGLNQMTGGALSQLGYNLGFGGTGISEPAGTAYNPSVTPQSYTSYVPDNQIGSSTANISTSNPGAIQGNNTWAPTSQGIILGAHTQTGGRTTQTQAPATQIQNQPPQQQQGSQQGPQQSFDPYAALRGQISSGWDNYTSQLGDMLNNGLPQQQSAQNNIINDQYNQGVNTANAQKSSSLKDIANTIKNSFQAGNNYLGARGAGDSSAGDMFNFATNQEANKQTSDLNQYVNSQLGNLSSQRDQQLNGVANWYANAQNQLKQAIASGSLSKSQDLSNLSSNILNQGLSMVNQIHQDAQSKYNALTQWAANNSGSLGALKNNMAAIGNAPASPIQMDSLRQYASPNWLWLFK